MVSLYFPRYSKRRRRPSVYYNSACLFVRGEMVAVYRKSHLPFSNGFPEKYYFRPADNTPTVTV